MISVQIVLHCFAHEIDELQRIACHLKRNLGMVDDVSWNFKFVLNLSTKTYDWKESKIDTEFFMSKFEYICSTWKLISCLNFSIQATKFLLFLCEICFAKIITVMRTNACFHNVLPFKILLTDLSILFTSLLQQYHKL